MDIPQEISEKIASYIRRPYKDEDILIIVGGGRFEICMPSDLFMKKERTFGRKESVIQRHAQWARRKWASGVREIFIYRERGDILNLI